MIWISCVAGLVSPNVWKERIVYVINPLKTKHVCFIRGLGAYRAVNTVHFGYKNQSLNVL
jgi:hypothetical protein